MKLLIETTKKEVIERDVPFPLYLQNDNGTTQLRLTEVNNVVYEDRVSKYDTFKSYKFVNKFPLVPKAVADIVSNYEVSSSSEFVKLWNECRTATAHMDSEEEYLIRNAIITKMEYDNDDAPDYCDAYIVAGKIDDRELSPSEIEILNDDADYVHEQLQNYIH
jgi:hypothetical protein